MHVTCCLALSPLTVAGPPYLAGYSVVTLRQAGWSSISVRLLCLADVSVLAAGMRVVYLQRPIQKLLALLGQSWMTLSRQALLC